MKNIAFGLVLVLGISAFAASNILQIDPSSTKVSFLAIGKPAMLRIHGEASEIISQISLEKVAEKKIANGSLKVLLSKFKTGIETRDEHMKKKYLEVDKFPEATLTLKDQIIPEMKVGEHRDLSFRADLNLHGVTQKVDVLAKLEELENLATKVHATSNIKLSDFKIEIPSYAGIKVADTVEFEIDFQTK